MGTSLAAKVKAANAALFVDGNLEAVGNFFTADYTVHFNEKDTAKGLKVIHPALGLIKGAFPKLRVKVEILVESEHRIAWMRTLRGMQTGSYKGFPASHRQIVWREMVTSELREGLIAEEWVVTDLAERLLLSRKQPARKRTR